VASPEDPFVIANACESAPLQKQTQVERDAEFWLKGQAYSLQDMLNFHPLVDDFVGGTVYQAFLSALSFHRWTSPVDGIVEDAFVVDGTYYLENLFHGFMTDKPDPSGPNESQAFLSAVATRAVIFIKSDVLGYVAFVGIGMAEVSSCEITVRKGQSIKKGEELGMFHFGGSTHCLIFGPQVTLDFIDAINENAGLHATNIAVNSKIATAKVGKL